jgi:hypothetical protein
MRSRACSMSSMTIGLTGSIIMPLLLARNFF